MSKPWISGPKSSAKPSAKPSTNAFSQRNLSGSMGQKPIMSKAQVRMPKGPRGK